jgi:adenylate cyclase
MKADPLPLPNRRRRLLAPLLGAVVAALAAVTLAGLAPRYAPGLLRFEHAMADVRTALLSDRPESQHPRVAVVSVTDTTLAPYKTRLPLERVLLARIIDAVDAAGAAAIGLDVLFTATAIPDGEDSLIAAIRRARAPVVLAAADERLGLRDAQRARQARFFEQVARPAGYANLAIERDWVVRFKAAPAPDTAFPKSFAGLLAETVGAPGATAHRRIAWLLDPRDGSDIFLTISAETLLGQDDAERHAAAQLKDKIVCIGAVLPDLDQHLTPLTSRTHERMAGVFVHAHVLAELLDGRHIGQLEPDAPGLLLGLACLTALGFTIGWRYRLRRKGVLLSSIATVAIIALDTLVFWQFRIILPLVLAVLAWFFGELAGHIAGRMLSPARVLKPGS